MDDSYDIFQVEEDERFARELKDLNGKNAVKTLLVKTRLSKRSIGKEPRSPLLVGLASNLEKLGIVRRFC